MLANHPGTSVWVRYLATRPHPYTYKRFAHSLPFYSFRIEAFVEVYALKRHACLPLIGRDAMPSRGGAGQPSIEGKSWNS